MDQFDERGLSAENREGRAAHDNGPSCGQGKTRRTPPLSSTSVERRVDYFYRGEGVELSPQRERAREQFLRMVLGPPAASDQIFDGALFAQELDGFVLSEDRMRIEARGRPFDPGATFGMGYSPWKVRLETKTLDSSGGSSWRKWPAVSMSGMVGTAFRDGRNRVTELCIAVDQFLGNVDERIYQSLFQKIIDSVPLGTAVICSMNDPVTLLELMRTLPTDYRDFDRPRDFFFTEEEVADVVACAEARGQCFQQGLIPLLSDRERTILETTLADASALRREVSHSAYFRIFESGLARYRWPGSGRVAAFNFNDPLLSYTAASCLLTHTQRAKIAYLAGLSDIRLKNPGSSMYGATEWVAPEGKGKFHVSFCAKKKEAQQKTTGGSLIDLIGSPPGLSRSTPTTSPARGLLDRLRTSRKADALQEMEQLGESPEMIATMVRFAASMGVNLQSVRQYVRDPGENLRVRSPGGTCWRMSHSRLQSFAEEIRAGNEGLGPLARSYYDARQRELMGRIKPDADFAVVFVHEPSNSDTVDRKWEVTSVLAAVEALQDLRYHVRTGSVLDFDVVDELPLRPEHRKDIAHLIDAVWGGLKQIGSEKAGIVCGFERGYDIDKRVKLVLPTPEELRKAGVDRISIEIEGIYSNDGWFRHARKSRLSVSDFLAGKVTAANEKSLSGISLNSDGEMGRYVSNLREAGISVRVRGLGDPSGESKFYNLERFTEIIEVARKALETENRDEVIEATAEVLDEQVAPVIGFMGGVGRYMPLPHKACIYAAQLDLLMERAIRDEDTFVQDVLARMKINSEFLMRFWEEQKKPTIRQRLRRVRDAALYSAQKFLT